MTSGTSENRPNFPFTVSSYEDWLEVARQELNGADPIKKLSLKKGNLEILPYYSASPIESHRNPMLKASSDLYHGARSWMNTPKIIVYDENQANETALSCLNAGADGVLFDCQANPINPKILLNKISLTDCSISFLMNDMSKKCLHDFQLFAESNFNKNEIKGCIFWRNITDIRLEVVQTFAQWPQFYGLGIFIETQEDAIDEIAHSLKQAVQLVTTLSEKKVSTQIVLDQISFSLSVGTDFFLEIAKMKSLRNLWYQIKGAYEAGNSKPLHIHAHSKAWVKDDYQPHSNMIKATTAAMASMMGGCDSLTIDPENETNVMMSRIARNVSSILREESHFSKVADPTAGSYYVDSITDQLSEKAWSKFQSLMK